VQCDADQARGHFNIEAFPRRRRDTVKEISYYLDEPHAVFPECRVRTIREHHELGASDAPVNCPSALGRLQVMLSGDDEARESNL
jgi:hypothetical protein